MRYLTSIYTLFGALNGALNGGVFGVSGEPIPDHLWMGTSVLLPLWTMIWDAAVLDPSLNSSRMGSKRGPKRGPI